LNLHLLPLASVYLLGAWVLWPLGWYFSLGYGLFVIASNLVYISTVCARCAYHGSDRCPSGYGAVSARLAQKGSSKDFPHYFNRYVPLVAAGWVLPLAGGAVLLVGSSGNTRSFVFNMIPLLIFAVVAFGVLPRSSRESCRRCPMRRSCPGARFTVGGGRSRP
jgi:hypothetical protein